MNASSSSRRHPDRIRRGLSLLEVIIATAILMAAAVTLARLSYVTRQNAQRAEDRTVGLEIAHYQMQELVAGLAPLENKALSSVLSQSSDLSTSPSSLGTNSLGQSSLDMGDGASAADHPWQDWQYSVNVQSAKTPGLLQVQVNVFRMPDSASAVAVIPNTGSGSAAKATPNDRGMEQSGEGALFQYSLVRLVRNRVGSAGSLTTRATDDF